MVSQLSWPCVPTVSSLWELTGEISSRFQYQEDFCFSQAPALVFTYKHWILSLNFVFPAIKLRTKIWPYFCSFTFSFCLGSFNHFMRILFCVSFLQTTSNLFQCKLQNNWMAEWIVYGYVDGQMGKLMYLIFFLLYVCLPLCFTFWSLQNKDCFNFHKFAFKILYDSYIPLAFSSSG